MNIYVLISVVMVSSIIFLAAALASPYKSILLPVNIPVQYKFESVHVIGPIAGETGLNSNGDNTYDIVVLGKDGSELLRLKPEEARGALQIVASDLDGNAKLIWGSSNDLSLYSTHDKTIKPFKASLTGPFASDGQEGTTVDIVGTESGFQCITRIVGESIVMNDFKWPLGGKSIPILGGMAETDSWIITTKPESMLDMKVNQGDQSIVIKYASLFTSPNVYAEDMTTGQRMPVPFESTVTGSVNPAPSQLPSYINSQIYLQVFGWLIPVAALMTIIWVDDRYRRKIRKMLRVEVPAQ